MILFIWRGGVEKPPYDGYWPWIHRYKAKPRLPPDGISQKSLSARSPCPWYHSQPYITPSRKEIFLQIKKNPNIYLAFWCRILQRWIPRETWFREQLSLFIKTQSLTLQSRTVRNWPLNFWSGGCLRVKELLLIWKRKINLSSYFWKFCRMVAKHNGLSWVLFPREPPK